MAISWANVAKQQSKRKATTSPGFSSHSNPTSSQRSTQYSSTEYSSEQSSSRSEKSLYRVNLISNAYSIRTTQLTAKFYEYIPHISISEGFRDVSPQVLYRNFVSRSIRRTIMEELIPQLIGSNVPKGSVVIEQNLEAIYSIKPFTSKFIDDRGENDNVFRFKNIPIKADLLVKIRIDIVFKFARTLSLNDNHGEYNMTFLNSILHHQLWINMLRYGAVYYLTQKDRRETNEGNRLDLMSNHVMGLSISGLRVTVNSDIILVIHCSHSYITNSHRLIDLLASFIFNKPVENLRLSHSSEQWEIDRDTMKEIRMINGSEEWFKTLCVILSGFKCKAVSDSERGIFHLRFKLTDKSASNLLMEDSRISGKLISVQEYYRQLGINLNYPNLPCLISNCPKHPYYPFEMCSLLSDQKVPIFRLSTSARNHLNLLNKPKAELAQKTSCEARNQLDSIAKNELETFGISISKIPMGAQGSILDRPTLQFKSYHIEPQKDYWESGKFFTSVHLIDNWCVVNTVDIEQNYQDSFFANFSDYCRKFGFKLGRPYYLFESKDDLIQNENCIENLIMNCFRITGGNLRLIMFVIDSNSTVLNRLIHLSFDEHKNVTATCLRKDSIMNARQHRAIFRTLVHKLNARLGGTNVTYHHQSLNELNLNPHELMIVGLDVTHPDNELSGVSIVGCAYTYSPDLFKHKSLVWPQTARVEIIGKLDVLMKRILYEYYGENRNCLPRHIIVYRDGVSHEEFNRVNNAEVEKAMMILAETAQETNQPIPNLSYVIAQKRHTMRFFKKVSPHNYSNPPSGTLIDQHIVSKIGQEFYLYSHTSPQATARPLHYYVLKDGLGFENLQKLTYFLCFNFGKCSGTLSMPSSLKYAHNAAYDARNRVIAAREFNENQFYTSKFFC